MLRILDRKITCAVRFRNNHIAFSSLRTSSSLAEVLQKLESTLSSNNRANADEILKNLHSLHSLQAAIPFSYFLDAANILSARNDATRLELLIHICKDNVRKLKKRDKKALQSRPSDDPLDQLVSAAISGLFSRGNKEDASKLWVRMSNSGYVTNRGSIELMINQVSSSYEFSPSLQLLDSLHNAMKAHLWHQNPQYYVKVFNLIRRYILVNGADSDALQKGVTTVEEMWLDAQKALVTCTTTHLPLELYALRLHCYAAAMHVSREGNSSLKDMPNYSDIATAAFIDLLEQSTAAGRRAAAVETFVSDISAEIAQILSGFKSSETNQSELFRAPVQNDALVDAGHKSLYSKVGDTRRSVHLFLKELAIQGQPFQAMNLLRQYIKRNSSSNADIDAVSLSSTQQRGFVDDTFRRAGANSVDSASAADWNASRATVIAALKNRSLFGTNVAFNGASSLNPLHVSIKKQYTAEEKIWQGDTVCALLQHANVAHSLMSQHDPKDGVSFELRVFKELETVFLFAKDILIQYQLKPGSKFYASFLDALSHNMQYVSDHPARSSDIVIPWQSSLDVARTLLDGADPRIADSAEVYHSLINLLCQGSGNPEPDPKAVLRALELIHEKGDDKHLIYPHTVAVLLKAATNSLDETLLSRVLIELEDLLRSSSVAPARSSNSDSTAMVLSARIFAHTRLREGYRALSLLRVYKSLDVKASRSMYLSLISSLYHSKPGSQWAKDVDTDPTATIEFLVEEMKRDRYEIDSHLVSRLLRLYTKAVVNAEDADSVLANMSKFVKRCRSGKGVLGSKEVVVDAQIVRELVKAHCLVSKFAQAQEIAVKCESLYGVKSTAEIFEPIIFKLSALNGQIAEAEGVILQLLNKGLLVTPAIVGSMVVGHLRHGESRDALDCVQDMRNLHGVLPTPAVWIMLLDASLSVGDVSEARRVVSFIRQLHTAEERELLVGPRAEDLFGTEVGNSVHDNAAYSDKLHIENKERQEAVFSYWNPLSYFKLGMQKSVPVEEQEVEKIPPRIPIRQNVPIGHRERGVLSDSALEGRFQRFGFSLK